MVTESYLADLLARLSNSYISLVHRFADNLSVTVSRTNSPRRVPSSSGQLRKTGALAGNLTKNQPSLRMHGGKIG